MSQFKDPRKIKTVKLPSFPEDSIEMYSTLTLGDTRKISEIPNDVDKGITTLIALIKSWTFTDENGGKLPINSDTLNGLPINDTTFIMSQIELQEPKKKENLK